MSSTRLARRRSERLGGRWRVRGHSSLRMKADFGPALVRHEVRADAKPGAYCFSWLQPSDHATPAVEVDGHDRIRHVSLERGLKGPPHGDPRVHRAGRRLPDHAAYPGAVRAR